MRVGLEEEEAALRAYFTSSQRDMLAADPSTKVRLTPGAEEPLPIEDVAVSSAGASASAIDEAAEADAAMAHPDSVQLSHEQRALVWEARKNEFTAFRLAVLKAIQSHHSGTDRCHLLMALTRKAEQRRFRLPTDLVEDMAFVLLRQALSGMHETATLANALGTHHVRSNIATPTGAAPRRHENAIARWRTLRGLDFGFAEGAWRLYGYALSTGTKPTPKLLQHMMRALVRGGVGRGGATELERRAHRIMADADTHRVAPTAFMLQDYAIICGRCHASHIALARFHEAVTSHGIRPVSGMVVPLLHALLRDDHIDQALQFVQSMHNVPVDLVLLNLTLEAYRRSSQPMAAFSAYRAFIPASGVAPDRVTVSTLLFAWYRERHRLLNDMFGVTPAPDADGEAAPGGTQPAGTDQAVELLKGSFVNQEKFAKSMHALHAAVAVKHKATFVRHLDPTQPTLPLRAAVLMARELTFLVQQMLEHRVSCNERDLNQMLQAMDAVTVDLEAATSAAGVAAPEFAVKAIRRFDKMSATMQYYMSQRRMAVHTEALLARRVWKPRDDAGGTRA
jgi:hypothetical protein